MGTQKIPDKNNFLEKFAAIQEHLKDKIQPVNKSIDEIRDNIKPSPPVETKATITEIEAPQNSQEIIAEPIMPLQKIVSQTMNEQLNPGNELSGLIELKCSNCGTVHTTEDFFCMNCGNKLQN